MVFNHLERIKGVSTKTGLIESLKTYYDKLSDAGKKLSIIFNIVRIGYNVFDSTPTTYILTSLLEGADYKAFNSALKSSRNRMGNEAVRK